MDPISVWAQSINWNAWGAIGTCGAVIVALWVSGQSNRAADEGRANTLVALSSIAWGLADVLKGLAERAERSNVIAEARKADALRLLRMPLEVLDRVDFTRFPDRKTVDQYLVIRSQAHFVEGAITATAMGRISADDLVSTLRRAEQLIREASETLHVRANKLSRPVFWRLIAFAGIVDPKGRLLRLLGKGETA